MVTFTLEEVNIMTLTQLRYAIEIANTSSMNVAAKNLFVSQPSLSESMKELESEVKINIFHRTNRGVHLTAEGKEFLGYARQVVEQYELMEAKYINRENYRQRFSVSTQHYTFAVNAFVEIMKSYGLENYDFSIFETKTGEIIDNVDKFRSELGILYLNDFNRQVLNKLFSEKGLRFYPLFDCHIYVYLCKEHPLAKKSRITLDELKDYPCLAFDQGDTNSFYFAEELYSTFDYKQIIHANDRATLLNLFVAMNGFTLCSGIICENLNGDNYCAVRLDSDELMTVGYIRKKEVPLSPIGQMYIEELSKYKEYVLE
jgi:DNA-binding transcriptional LysR family regulator